jgi:hypothetical protein
MKDRTGTNRRRVLVLAAAAAAIALALAPTAWAAPAAATAAVSPTTPGAGTTTSYTYTLTPSSGQIGSFNLTAPNGWTVGTVSPQTGIDLVSGVIQGRGLTITSSSPLSVTFSAQAPCAAGTVAWSTTAKTGGNFTGASVSVNAVPASVSGNCTAAFVTGRQPADAAFNANTSGPSENITSDPYTPDGAAIQAVVKDASGAVRPGTSLTLVFDANPTTATLSGSTTAVSNASGVATFDGACATCSPIAISKIGQGYTLKPTGTGVVGTASAAFGIYQEGDPCTTDPCVVHGHNGNNSILTTVSAPSGGDLGTFVSADVSVSCADYTGLTADSIVWKYTGSGSQTITITLSKQVIRQVLDRGSDHLDFCFDSEGKAFTDKFGVDHWGDSGNDTNGLLSDCNTGIDVDNCIVSETGTNGGGRQVTVIVEDGKGRI